MHGRGTDNEVDVLWEGQIDDSMQRIVIECKHYKRRVDQGRLHAFRSVLDDITDDVPTTGVFVTTQGYQSGAQSLAKTYGLVVLELRPPRKDDLVGRVTQIVVSMTARMEIVEDVHVDADWVSKEAEPADNLAVAVDQAWLDLPDGTTVPLRQSLTEGERSELGRPPTPPHRVRRDFPIGTTLRIGDQSIQRLRSIAAVVGDSDTKATHTIGPGADGIAHILKDAITGATVWFEKDGRITMVS